MKDATRSNNPYPGLRPFQFSESHLFFGRERQSEELLRKLRRNRFLAVVGTSGSGKSSLVRAGLLPLIERGFAADAGTRWRIALFRPGKNPINNMALALNSPNAFKSPYADGDGAAQVDGQENSQLRAEVIETTLRRSALGLADHARRATDSKRENLLVCVDQFEELFRFKEKSQRSSPEDEAAAFVKLLLEAARDKSVAVYVLLTMRSDFLGDCSQFRDLPEAINEGQYLIPRMTRDEQRAAVAEPAASLGAQMTPRLVQRLLNDVGDNPDHLPLLQHALMRTWDHWAAEKGAGPIDLDHYKAVGGMQKALSNHAEQTYESLPDDRRRKIAEKLFKALTETIVNDREIRRPAELQEICAIAGAKPDEVIPVIDHFRLLGRSFLMPPPGTELTAETVIDISHESLIKGWDLLKKWVEQEAKSKAMYQRVADAAKRRYKDEGGASLWRDPDLKFALEWKERANPNEAWAQRYDTHFKEAMQFLKESEEEQKRELKEKEDRLKEEREREERERQLELKNAQDAALYQQKVAENERQRAVEQERFARRLKVALAALVAMFLLATGLAVYAFTQKSRADQSALQLAAALEGSEKLSAERETARLDAVEASQQAEKEKLRAEAEALRAAEASAVALEAEAEAERQKILAQNRAQQLQTTLNKLESAEKGRASAELREDAEREGLIALEKGDVQGAEDKFSFLLDHYDENDSSLEGQAAWSWASYNLGKTYEQAKDYDKAVEYYGYALKEQKSLFGRRSREIVPALYRLAHVYHEQNNYEASGKAYEELSTLLERLGDENNNRERIASVKREIAKLFQDEARDFGIGARQKGEELNAIEDKIEAAETRAESAPLAAEQQRDMEKARLRLGLLQEDIEKLRNSAVEKYAAAEVLYKEVLTEREKLLLTIHPNLIEAYNDLAAFYQDRAQSYEEDFSPDIIESTRAQANDLYKLARIIRYNKLSPEGADEAEAKKIETLAEAYEALKRYGPAEKLLKRLLEIKRGLASNEIKEKSTAGLVHLSLASTLVRLTSLLYEQDRDAEAKPLFDELLKLLDTVASKPSAEVMLGDKVSGIDGLVAFFSVRNRYAELESITERLNAIQEKVLSNAKGKESRAKAAWDLTSGLEELGTFRYMQKNYLAAEQAFKDSLAIIKKEFGPDSGLDYSPSFKLAKLYFEQGRYDEALPLFRRVEAMFVNKIGPQQRATGRGNRETLLVNITKNSGLILNPGDYLDTLSGLADIYSKRGENQNAEQVYKELLAASEWVSLSAINLTSGVFNEKQRQAFSDHYWNKYADALESYAAFLKKPEVNRAAEAKAIEERAAEIRRRIGPKKEPNPLQ